MCTADVHGCVPRVGRLRARRVDARRGLGLEQMHALQHLLVLSVPLAGRPPEWDRPIKSIIGHVRRWAAHSST